MKSDISQSNCCDCGVVACNLGPSLGKSYLFEGGRATTRCLDGVHRQSKWWLENPVRANQGGNERGSSQKIETQERFDRLYANSSIASKIYGGSVNVNKHLKNHLAGTQNYPTVYGKSKPEACGSGVSAGLSQ